MKIFLSLLTFLWFLYFNLSLSWFMFELVLCGRYMILPNHVGGKCTRIGKPVSRDNHQYVFDSVGIMLHGTHNFCTKMARVVKVEDLLSQLTRERLRCACFYCFTSVYFSYLVLLNPGGTLTVFFYNSKWYWIDWRHNKHVKPVLNVKMNI